MVPCQLYQLWMKTFIFVRASLDGFRYASPILLTHDLTAQAGRRMGEAQRNPSTPERRKRNFSSSSGKHHGRAESLRFKPEKQYHGWWASINSVYSSLSKSPRKPRQKKSSTKCESFMIGNSTLSFCFCSNSILRNGFHAHPPFKKDEALKEHLHFKQRRA